MSLCYTSAMSKSVKLLWWLPPATWMGLIFYLSSLTGLGGPEWKSYVAHVVEYGGLAGLFWLALTRTTSMELPLLSILAVVFATVYGLSDEWHQSFVPGRVADPLDILTDFVAAVAAVALMRTVSKRVER